MTDNEKLNDFMRCYASSFNRLFGVDEDTLRHYYLEDRYKGYPETPGGSAWDSELKALYCAIRITKPKKVLEIGNYIGTSTNHILLAVEKNGVGEVHLVDIMERLKFDQLHSTTFTRHLVDSLEYLRTAELDFDFIAHDGCHEYGHVKAELQTLKERSSTDFAIWSHDYYAKQTKHVNVKQAWDEEGAGFHNWIPMKDSFSDCGIVLGKFSTDDNR